MCIIPFYNKRILINIPDYFIDLYIIFNMSRLNFTKYLPVQACLIGLIIIDH